MEENAKSSSLRMLREWKLTVREESRRVIRMSRDTLRNEDEASMGQNSECRCE